MLKRVLFRATALVAVLALGGSAKADFIIDDFSVPDSASAYNQLIGQSTSMFSATDTSAPGVTRTSTATVTADILGGGTARVRLGQFTGGNRFSLSTDDGLTATATLNYSYAAPQDLAAGGTSVQFTFASADLGVPYSIQLTDGTNTATQSGTTTTGAGTYSFSTASFGGVDLTAVTGVTLSLNQTQSGGGPASVVSADFSLTDVRVLTPTAAPVIPAPPAAVLVLAALPVLGLARARRMLPV
jgi:hypothetical protein